MSLLKTINLKKIKIILIFIFLAALPLSKFILSISQFLLVFVWILEGDIKSKFTNIIKSKSTLFFLLFYFISVVGIFYTSDLKTGFFDLQTKLPLLILPLIINSIDFTEKDVKFAIYCFTGALFIKSLSSIYILIGNNFSDTRQLSVNLSHIRFSLMINISIFSAAYLLFSKKFEFKKIEIYLLTGILIWFSIFLFILQSITGMMIFLIINYFLIMLFTFRIKNLKQKYLMIFIIFIIPISALSYLSYSVYDFYDVKEKSLSNLDNFTSQGNEYKHDTINLLIENKHYTWLYVCENEMRTEWSKKSSLTYDSLDNNGNLLKYTLIRYLTSKGLRKDADGVKVLSENDVSNIENGIANYLFTNKLSIYTLIYKIIWQIDVYLKTGESNGYSVIQRFEYIKTGFEIFKQNIVFGVGTGDIDNAYASQYEIENSKLSENFRKLSHNQYLTNLIKFGIIGFFVTILALLFPFINNKKYKQFLPSIFFIIFMLSMLNEDTLQTQVGVSFAAVFYCLFILSETFIPSKNKS